MVMLLNKRPCPVITCSLTDDLLLLHLIITSCLHIVVAANGNDSLSGSKRRFPGTVSAVFNNPNVTRLLDVGACITSLPDSTVSYVPPLDGTNPHDTLCQDEYAMKFVLYDVLLADLKAVDSVAGSFRAKIQMIFHWLDNLDRGSNETDVDGHCNLLCDTNPRSQLCCDNVWVPPLSLFGCDINEIQSSIPQPSIQSSIPETSIHTKRVPLSFHECLEENNYGKCYWRRLWYLTMDVTCTTQMDFRSFPFDVQSLTINILNPYASRTFFQITKGFLERNVGASTNSVKLSPDKDIPGWSVKDVAVSSDCGLTQAWKETFITQDSLLLELQDSHGGYASQHDNITDTFAGELKCVGVEDILNNTNMDLESPLNRDFYWSLSKPLYVNRVNSTLQEYDRCIKQNGKDFLWNMSIHDVEFMSIRGDIASRFSTSDKNIERSFNVLNLHKNQNGSKVWFPCVINAIANLTTPGIRVTILVQRYRRYYFLKIIFPILACVAFSFTVIGLHPDKLLGRLGVVVPSAIALTALQGFVVATDMPPVDYTAPSTLIFLFSYLVQILIAYESVLVKCFCAQERSISCERVSSSSLSRKDAPSMRANSNHRFKELSKEEGALSAADEDKTSQNLSLSIESPISSSLARARTQACSSSKETDSSHCMSAARRIFYLLFGQMSATINFVVRRWSTTRIVDFVILVVLGLAYIVAVVLCTSLPFRSAEMEKRQIINNKSVVSIWNNP